MNPRVAAFVVLVILAAGIGPAATSQQAPSPAPGVATAPWWPEDVTQSSEFRAGWNLRIPLTVTSPTDRPTGSPAQVHLDLAQSMIEGGWPESADIPSLFRAYPESVRLVEYEQGWSGLRRDGAGAPVVVPTHTYPTWLDTDQQERYDRVQTGPFDGQRSALVTMAWLLPRPLPAGDTHHYFAYFDIEQNAGAEHDHRKPVPALSGPDRERLDGLYWVGAGTTLHGHAHGRILISATQPDTHVEVYVYKGVTGSLDEPRPVNVDGQNRQQEPEFTLQAGQSRDYYLGFVPKHFRVEADGPVTVLSYGFTTAQGVAGARTPEFVPSDHGGPLGRSFTVPPIAGSVTIIAPPGNERQVCLVGTTQCQSIGTAFQTFPFTLPSTSSLEQPHRLRVQSTGTGGQEPSPVLVQFRSTDAANPAQAASSLGAPVGFRFHTHTLATGTGTGCAGGDLGGFRLISWSDDVPVDIALGGQRPYGSAEDLTVDALPEDPLRLSGAPLPGCGLVGPVNLVPQDDASIQVQAGRFDASQATPFGGRHGFDVASLAPGHDLPFSTGSAVHARGPFAVYSYYPSTRLAVIDHEDGQITETTLGLAGTPVQFHSGRAGAMATVLADKPVSVFPCPGNSPVTCDPPASYARFHAAKPDFLVPTIYPGDYRGYVFDARPADGGEPVFLDGEPGTTATADIRVINLARWTDGEPLADTLRFTALHIESQPPGVTVPVSFGSNAMALSDAVPKTNRVSLDLPGDIPPDTQLTVTVRVHSENNPEMVRDITLVVRVRQTFDVDMWFEETNSDNLRVRLQEAQQRAIPFILQNLGSGTDSFDLLLTAPGGGWQFQITRDAQGNQPITRLSDVTAGDHERAFLHITAPATHEPGGQVKIEAVSTTSPLASKPITLDVKIDLEQDLEVWALDLHKTIAPGTTGRFEIRVINTGEDAVALGITLESQAPEDWTIALEGPGDPSKPPITLFPATGGSTNNEALIPVLVTVPADAPAGLLVPILLRAEAVGDGQDARDSASLAAVVGSVNQLEVRLPDALTATPGEALPITVNISNGGNGLERVDIVPLSLPAGWTLTQVDPAVPIAPGQAADVQLELRMPASHPAGATDMLLEARGGGVGTTFSVPIHVEEVRAIAWAEPPTLLMQPGESAKLLLRLENQGNTRERVTIQPDPTWSVQGPGEAINVDPGAFRFITLTVQAPTAAGGSDSTLSITARTASGVTAVAEVPVRVGSPQVELDRFLSVEPPRGSGGVGTVIAALHNPGQVSVRSLEVRLLGSEGAVLDAVRSESVGPGGTVVVPLRWSASDAAQVDRIEWGRLLDGEYTVMGSAQLPTDEGGEVLEASASGALALIAALAAVALLCHGRRRL